MQKAIDFLFKNASQQVTKTFNRKIIKDNVFNSFEECIGNTPLLKLKRASQITGCNIYGKCEFMNPGGSIKDRAALYLIMEAEEKGILTPGKPGYIIEGSTGNTGIGLALIGNNRGYKTIILIPETQSQEKKDMIKFSGAQLIDMQVVPYKNPNHYQRIGKRMAEKLPNCFFANQYDNKQNRKAHYETTGPEIYVQLDGKIDGFNCAIGTGGTLAGVAMYLKEQNSKVKISISGINIFYLLRKYVDPNESTLVNLFNEGVNKNNGDSITEGIGQARVTGNILGLILKGNFDDIKHLFDYAHYIDDHESFETLQDLLQFEGLCLGLSSGVNVAGAVKLAKELGPGHNIVTVLCDYGTKYPKKIFNPKLLLEKGFPAPQWLIDEPPIQVVNALIDSFLSQEEVDKEIESFKQTYYWPGMTY